MLTQQQRYSQCCSRWGTCGLVNGTCMRSLTNWCCWPAAGSILHRVHTLRHLRTGVYHNICHLHRVADAGLLDGAPLHIAVPYSCLLPLTGCCAGFTAHCSDASELCTMRCLTEPISTPAGEERFRAVAGRAAVLERGDRRGQQLAVREPRRGARRDLLSRAVVSAAQPACPTRVRLGGDQHHLLV